MNSGQARPETRGGTRQTEEEHKTVESIVEFVKRFPVRESHYSRNRTERQYLGPDLSIAKIFALWRSQRQERGERTFTYASFHRIVNTHFKLGFGHPKTDICSTCETLNNAIKAKGEGVHELRIERKVHLHKAKKFHQILQASRDDPSTLACTFDLMQNQPLPKVNITETYYKRQLWLYTLGIIFHRKDQSKRNVFLYHWTENESGKGSNEVCSALNNALSIKIRRIRKRKRLLQRYRNLDLFCDSCPGQNKNHSMLAFLLRFVNSKENIFRRIRIIFPVRGHSYLPPDRVFGRVEKDIKKKEYITAPSEYYNIFQKHGTLKILGKDWQVKDYKNLSKQVLRTNTNVPMRNSKIWEFHKNDARVKVCTTYFGAHENYVILKKNVQAIEGHKPKIVLNKSHVSTEKKKDVRDLLQFVVLDDAGKAFYENALKLC